jgi:hypothetical protein
MSNHLYSYTAKRHCKGVWIDVSGFVGPMHEDAELINFPRLAKKGFAQGSSVPG